MAKQSTMRALLTGVLAMLICLTMLVGATFAWFTAGVSSSRNRIISGNLDMELSFKASLNEKYWKIVGEDTELFPDAAIWIPTHTEVIYFRVQNKGTLAFKYHIDVSVLEDDLLQTDFNGASLYVSDVIMAGSYVAETEYNADGSIKNTSETLMAERVKDYDLDTFATEANAKISEVEVKNSYAEVGTNKGYDFALLPGEEQIGYIVLHMPKEVGNEANIQKVNPRPHIKYGITCVATQYTYESDSFDDQYDYYAVYPIMTGEELVYLMNQIAQEGGNQNEKDYSILIIGEDISIDSLTIPAGQKVYLDLNNKTLTVTGGDITVNGELVISEFGDINFTSGSLVTGAGGKITDNRQ